MGGKRKLSPEQTAKVGTLTRLHDEYVLARTEMRVRIEEEYRSKLRDYDFRESRLMNEALLLGVPKTDIAAAVKNSHWQTLQDKYALTAGEFVAVERAPQLPEFVIDYATANKSKSGDKFVVATVGFYDLVGEYVEGPITVEFYKTWMDGWLIETVKDRAAAPEEIAYVKTVENSEFTATKGYKEYKQSIADVFDHDPVLKERFAAL